MEGGRGGVGTTFSTSAISQQLSDDRWRHHPDPSPHSPPPFLQRRLGSITSYPSLPLTPPPLPGTGHNLASGLLQMPRLLQAHRRRILQDEGRPSRCVPGKLPGRGKSVLHIIQYKPPCSAHVSFSNQKYPPLQAYIFSTCFGPNNMLNVLPCCFLYSPPIRPVKTLIRPCPDTRPSIDSTQQSTSAQPLRNFCRVVPLKKNLIPLRNKLHVESFWLFFYNARKKRLCSDKHPLA